MEETTAHGLVQEDSTARPTAEQPFKRVPPLTPRQRAEIIERDGGQCTAPGCTFRTRLEVHHITPRWAGGSNDPENLRTLCSPHHDEIGAVDDHRALIAWQKPAIDDAIAALPGVALIDSDLLHLLTEIAYQQWTGAVHGSPKVYDAALEPHLRSLESARLVVILEQVGDGFAVFVPLQPGTAIPPQYHRRRDRLMADLSPAWWRQLVADGIAMGNAA